MRVNDIPPKIWVSMLAVTWLLAGFVFFRMDHKSSPELADVIRASLLPGERRILLVGGSNAIGGFDSKLFAAAIGRSVVNLSLINVGGDERLVWALTKATAKPGDVVILSFRSFFSSNTTDVALADANDKQLARELGSAYHPIHVALLPWRPLPSSVTLARALTSSRDAPLPASPVEMSKACTSYTGVPADFSFKPRPDAYWRTVGENVAALTRKGITVYATMPWLLVEPADRDNLRGAIADAKMRLAQMRVGLVESSIDDDILSDATLFCDSAHLNAGGAVLHTNYIAKRMAPLLPR